MKSLSAFLRFITLTVLLATAYIGSAAAVTYDLTTLQGNLYHVDFGSPSTVTPLQTNSDYLNIAAAFYFSLFNEPDKYSSNLNSEGGIDASQFGGCANPLGCQIIFLYDIQSSDVLSGRAVNISGASVTQSNVQFSFSGTDLTNKTFAYYVAPEITSPVPEPSTLALMLAGFGLIGFKSRRRNKLSA